MLHEDSPKAVEESVPASLMLWNLAQRCGGLSGRTLRRLPYLALALHGQGDYFTLEHALQSLDIAINDQLDASADWAL